MSGLNYSNIKNIVCIGDCNVYGLCDFENGGYVGMLRRWHNSQDPTFNRVYNLGIPNTTSQQLIERIKSEVTLREPDLILISVGMYDCVRLESKHNYPEIYPELFKEKINTILDIAINISPVLWVGMHPIDDYKTTPYKDDQYYILYDLINYEDEVKKICESRKVSYVDIMNKWLKEDYKDYLDVDGLLLNPIGHKKVFELITLYMNNNV